jgi:peptidoglycan/LPS O-acetylase OafA/YrhL
MSDRTMERRVRWACALALTALGLMAWGVLDPRPIPVVLAMSVGQVIGTASLGLYLIAVVADLRRSRALARALEPSKQAAEAPPSRPAE